MTHHSTWFKRTFNPILRKIFKIEICSIISEGKIIGYGVRKFIKESKLNKQVGKYFHNYDNGIH
jgi:hypothetical protein